MNRIACLFAAVCLLAAFKAAAAEKHVLTATHKYTLQDTDSRNDGRWICFREASRKLTGAVQKTLTKAAYGGDHWFEKQDIQFYAPLLLKLETEEERWLFQSERLSVEMTLRTEVDPDYLGRRLAELKEDPELQEKIKKDRRKLEEMENRYAELQTRLAAVGSDGAFLLRKERQAVAEEIDRLEKIRYFIADKTSLVGDKIEVGMTMDEVISLAGQPRATAVCEHPDFLNYGKIWVLMRNGIVSGTVQAENWQGPCYPYFKEEKQKEKVEIPRQTVEADKYEIILKSGQVIPTPNYYQIEDVVYYKRFGGIVGIEEEKIAEIREK